MEHQNLSCRRQRFFYKTKQYESLEEFSNLPSFTDRWITKCSILDLNLLTVFSTHTNLDAPRLLLRMEEDRICIHSTNSKVGTADMGQRPAHSAKAHWLRRNMAPGTVLCHRCSASILFQSRRKTNTGMEYVFPMYRHDLEPNSLSRHTIAAP